MSTSAPSQRIVSMDQFRGYTVAGMFVVNFLGSYAAIHAVLRHNNNYFSYADSIMPSFMFAVGFSFRLTYLRRRAQLGRWRTIWTYVRRSLELVVVSLVMYGFGDGLPRWSQRNEMPAEFQSFRAKAPATASFAILLSKAKEAHPNAAPRDLIAEASRIGSLINQNRSDAGALRDGDATPDDAVAKQAEQTALAEGESYIRPAIDRKRAWDSLDDTGKLLVHWRIHLAKLLKSDLWETLALIGITQIVVLPFVGCGFLTRFLVLVGFGAVHCALSYWFNWDFLYGVNDNWMSKLWMTGTNRSWDGGFFGPLSWGMAMTAGTVAYDLVIAARSRGAAAVRLIAWGVAFMAIGYGMSCLTRLYEMAPAELAAMKDRYVRQDAEQNWLETLIQRQGALLAAERKRTPPSSSGIERLDATIGVLRDQQGRYPNLELATGPVLPPWERLKGRSFVDMLVEPTFVGPPRDVAGVDAPPLLEHRLHNYWMMGKRMPNLSFMTFATGFAFALYALFVLACDLGGLSVGLFTTFGTNALVAYFLHHVVAHAVEPLVPHDAPLLYCLAGFALFLWLTYVLVRYLEKRGIYVKL